MENEKSYQDILALIVLSKGLGFSPVGETEAFGDFGLVAPNNRKIREFYKSSVKGNSLILVNKETPKISVIVIGQNPGDGRVSAMCCRGLKNVQSKT